MALVPTNDTDHHADLTGEDKPKPQASNITAKATAAYPPRYNPYARQDRYGVGTPKAYTNDPSMMVREGI